MIDHEIANMIYDTNLSVVEIEVLLNEHSKKLNANLVTGANLAYLELCYLFEQTKAPMYGSVWAALLALEESLNMVTKNKYTQKIISKKKV